MILVTGGLGFVGSHTTRALLDLGESCVLVQRSGPVLPGDLAGEAGKRVFTERADVADLAALRETAGVPISASRAALSLWGPELGRSS